MLGYKVIANSTKSHKSKQYSHIQQYGMPSLIPSDALMYLKVSFLAYWVAMPKSQTRYFHGNVV